MATEKVINIRANSDQARGAFEALSKSVKSLASVNDEATKNSARLKAALADPANAGKSVNEIVRALGDLDSNAKRAVGTVADLNKGVAALSDTTGTAAKQADNLGSKIAAMSIEDKIRSTRNWGLALGAAGAGGLVLSNALAEAGREAEESENLISVSFGNQLGSVKEWSKGIQESLGLSARELEKNAATFNIMLKSMGLTEKEALDMSKSLTFLAAEMESLYNLDPGQAFDKLRSGITGEAEPLKAIGILVGEETIKQYAYKNGIAAVGDELTEQQKVLARYGAILAQTTDAQGDLVRSYDTAQAAARRAAVAQKDAMAAVGKGSAEAQKSIDEFTGSLLKAANVSPQIAEGAGAMQTYGSYALTAAAGVTVFAATVLQGAIALQDLGGASAVWGAITTAIGTAQAAIIAWGTSAVASMSAATAAALPYLVVMGKIALVALAAAAAIWLVDKALHAREDKALADNIKAGEGKDDESLAILNRARAREGLPPIAKNNDSGASDAPVDPTEQIAAITKTVEDAQSGKIPTPDYKAPAFVPPDLGASASTSSPSQPMVRDHKTGEMRPAMNLSVEPGSDEQYEKDIRALEDKIRDEVDKKRKKLLQDEVREFKRSFAARKKRAAAAQKARADSLKALGIEAAAVSAERTAELLESSARLRGGAEIEGFRDKRALSRDVRDVRDRVKTGALDSETGSARIQALRDAYAARETARQADLEEQIAQIDAQTALAEGAARAAGQTGALAQSTLRIARARADRVVNVAAAKAQSLREEARSLAQDADDALRTTNTDRVQKSNAATRELAAALAAGRLRGSYDRSVRGGAMFGMRGGDYGNAPAFVGNDPRAMAAGIEAARSNFGRHGRGDGYSERTSGTTLQASVQSIVRDALGNIVVQFAPVKIAQNDSLMEAAQLLQNN